MRPSLDVIAISINDWLASVTNIGILANSFRLRHIIGKNCCGDIKIPCSFSRLSPIRVYSLNFSSCLLVDILIKMINNGDEYENLWKTLWFLKHVMFCTQQGATNYRRLMCCVSRKKANRKFNKLLCVSWCSPKRTTGLIFWVVITSFHFYLARQVRTFSLEWLTETHLYFMRFNVTFEQLQWPTVIRNRLHITR